MKTTALKTLSIILFCTLLMSCQSTLKRYELREYSVDATDGDVKVSSFVSEVVGSSKKSEPIILQLHEKGQAALINAVAQHCKDADCIYESLSEKFPTKSRDYNLDNTKLHIQLIFSIEKVVSIDKIVLDDINNHKGKYIPENRIERVSIIVENEHQDHVSFTKWDKFVTEYKKVELGSISRTKTLTHSASISPDNTGTVTGGSNLSISHSDAKTESKTIKDRIITNVMLTDDEISLLQEGIVGIDLEGNSSVKLHITLDGEPADIFRINSGQSKGDKMVLEEAKLIMPSYELIAAFNDGLKFKLSGEYVLRDVVGNGKTIDEGDDSIILRQGNLVSANNHVSILSLKQLKNLRSRYYLCLKKDPGAQLSIETIENPYMSLDFASYSEADQFLTWLLKNKKTMVDGRQLSISQTKLQESQIQNLQIKNRVRFN